MGEVDSPFTLNKEMKLYGLFGYPVKHSYSAIMHNAAFKELGIDARYELFAVAPENLEEEFRKKLAQGICGFNVTVPHKERIIKFLDRLDTEAELIGAVNTVKVDPAQGGGVNMPRFTQGFNTDGQGFITHLMQVVGFSPQGKRISILGAGGAAKAVAIQLARHKAEGLFLFDIERKRLKELVLKLQANFPHCTVQAVAEANALLKVRPALLINATPVGMHKEEPLIFDSELLYPQLIVYDLIYNPAQTPLLQEARRKRCRGVFNGLGMLLYQGAAAFKIWLEVEPPIEVMERALRAALRA